MTSASGDPLMGQRLCPDPDFEYPRFKCFSCDAAIRVDSDFTANAIYGMYVQGWLVGFRAQWCPDCAKRITSENTATGDP